MGRNRPRQDHDRGGAPAVLLVLSALALLFAASGCGRAPEKPVVKPNILLIGLDTLRYDHLHCAGNDWIETPGLDGLAADGVLFTECRSTAPWTLPSFASIFTGLLPYRHGAIGGDHLRLPDEVTTLAEHLDAAGYATTAFVGINYLTNPFGMHQGYNQPPPEHIPDDMPDQSSLLTWLGLDFLSRPREQPSYLFLHYFDIHTPYTPPAPYDRMYYQGDEKAPGQPIMDLLLSDENRAENKGDGMYDFLADVTDIQFPVRQYAAGVSYVDSHVARVLKRLKELGMYDDMLIVAVSDHGEHLGEREIWFTHSLPYDETMHVPLIVKLPGNRDAGRVVDKPVSTLDIMPTMLAAAGLPVPDGLDGRDLGKLLDGRRDGGHSLIAAEKGSNPEDLAKALVEWPLKLIWLREDGVDRFELYDLAADPGELQDLSADMPRERDLLKRRMFDIFDPASPLLEHPVPARPADLDAAAQARLKSLGY